MRIRLILAPLALVLLVTSQVMSQQVTSQYSARESFAYVNGKSLDTLGAAKNGWGSPWIIDTTSSHNFAPDTQVVVSETGFSYGDLYNTSIPHIGNNLAVKVPGSWGSGRFKRALEKTWPDAKGQYWVSFLFQIDSVPTGNTYYLFKLYSGNNERLAIGKAGGDTKYSCGSGWSDPGTPDKSGTDAQAGPVWLVTMINLTGDATADASARIYMWINPDPAAAPDTNSADVKKNTDMTTGFNSVALEYGGELVNVLSFDEIRLGTSFADVSSPLVTTGYLAFESFEYPASANAYLTGSGGAENGWAGPWQIVAGSGAADSLMVVSDTGITYGDITYEPPHKGSLLVGLKPAAKFARYERALDKTWPATAGTKYWISLIMHLKNDTSVNSWAGVKLYNGHGGELMMFGKGWGLNVFTVGSGAHSSASDPECSQTTWDSGPVWLVGEIFISGNANVKDKTYMWVSPNPLAEPDTNSASAKALPGISPNGFNYVRIEFGGDLAGMEANFDEIRLGTSYLDVMSGVPERINKVPSRFALSQNYPNPFNPTTRIEYSIVRRGYVTLKVYNILGQEVATLFAGVQNPGTYQASFNAGKIASGVYFYRLTTDNSSITKKMVLMK